MKRYYTISEISRMSNRAFLTVRSRAKHLRIDVMNSRIDSRNLSKLIESLECDHFRIHPRTTRTNNMNNIESVVSEYFKTDVVKVIKKKTRKEKDVMIRSIVFYFMKTKENKKNKYLSSRYGYDVDKFSKAVNYVNNRMSYENKFKKIIKDLIERL